MATANNLINSPEVQQQLNHQILKAARLGKVENVKALIAKGANINAIEPSNGRSPLISAALNGHTEVVIMLLAVPSLLINHVTRSGNTALMAACLNGHIAAVRAMLFFPLINLHAANQEGSTAIVLALEEGYPLIVRLLQEQGAVLPLYLTQNPFNTIEDSINSSQSVHETSVHLSVSTSAKNLVAHYQYDAQQIAEAINSLKAWLTTEWDPLAKRPTEYKAEWVEPARRSIARLNSVNFIDHRSNVSLQEALALVWTGINDPKAQGEEKPWLEAKELTDRRITFLKHLYEIHRAYNLSNNANPLDNGEIDRPTCPSGSFNKLIAALSEVGHHAVQVIFVTSTLINEQVPILTKQAFRYLAHKQKAKFCEGWQGKNADAIQAECFDLLQSWVSCKLHEKYDEFNKEVPNLNQVITEAVSNVEYIALDDTINQERAVLESEKNKNFLNQGLSPKPIDFLWQTTQGKRDEKIPVFQEAYPTLVLDTEDVRKGDRLKN